MPRCIAVLTVPRSGSSALAGALHSAGLSFGESELIGPHKIWNPKGHYEIRQWHEHGQNIMRRVVSGLQPLEGDIAGIANIIAMRNAATPTMWGVKSAWLSYSLPYILPYLPADLRLLVMHRNFTAQVESNRQHLENGTGTTLEAAQRVVIGHRAQLYTTAHKLANYPQYHVQFEALTEEPERVLSDVLWFCCEGIAGVSTAKIESATEFIEKGLRHW